MCVLLEASFRGLSVTSTTSPLLRPLFDTRLVRSKISLSARFSHSSFAKPSRTDTSVTVLEERSSHVRLVACSKPFRLLMPASLASRLSNVAICA